MDANAISQWIARGCMAQQAAQTRQKLREEHKSSGINERHREHKAMFEEAGKVALLNHLNFWIPSKLLCDA